MPEVVRVLREDWPVLRDVFARLICVPREDWKAVRDVVGGAGVTSVVLCEAREAVEALFLATEL